MLDSRYHAAKPPSGKEAVSPHSCAVKQQKELIVLAGYPQARERRRTMELFVMGILTGLLACVLAMLVRCAYWYEITHPEDDYWHRRKAPRQDGKPGGDDGTEK